jgi:hypothetical protein
MDDLADDQKTVFVVFLLAVADVPSLSSSSDLFMGKR